MPTNINTFRIAAYETLINKSQSGNSISDSQVAIESQFNILCNLAQLEALAQDYKLLITTKGQFMTQFLQTYLKRKIPLAVTDAVALFPSDFLHTSSMGCYYKGIGRGFVANAEAVTNNDWNNVKMSKLYTPTPLFPKYTEFDSYFEFAPETISLAYLDYIKTPNFPIWKYTIVNDTPVYNPTGSVDFEFDEYAQNRIIGIFIKLVCINLNNKELIQYGEAFSTQNT